MTSGQFHAIPIDLIIVNRDARQRRELTDVDILADSIRRLGLIHPLVITRTYELVTGERRLAACRSLGWTAITVQYIDELDPAALRAVELEENIKRKDIPWQDQAHAIQEYHALRRAQEPNWSQTDTADAIGLSKAQVSSYLAIVDEITKGNKLVTEAPKFSVAEGIVRRAQERRDANILAHLKETIIGGPPDETRRALGEESILNMDFNTWARLDHAPRFNLVHCDFPYGIEANAFQQGAAPAHGGYLDTKEVWEALTDSLAIVTKTACTPSCHLIFWFAMRKGDVRLYEPTVRRLELMGWNINPMPLIWMKSDNVGILPDPERGPRQIYETCLLGSRGDRKIVRAVANGYHAPTVRDRHMSEKPEPVLRHFFGMLVDENTILLDPTCGSGSALRAAESLGAKFVLGIEHDKEFCDRAREALERARALRKLEKANP